MFVILTYDFEEKRVQKALKICRKYLHWVQNSVFEGYLSFGKLEKLKMELMKIMDETTDSVRIYTLDSEKYVEKEILGVNKEESDGFI